MFSDRYSPPVWSRYFPVFELPRAGDNAANSFNFLLTFLPEAFKFYEYAKPTVKT